MSQWSNLKALLRQQDTALGRDAANAIIELEFEIERRNVFIRRFSRWCETPNTPDIFFGRLNVLYEEAKPFDDQRSYRDAREEG